MNFIGYLIYCFTLLIWNGIWEHVPFSTFRQHICIYWMFVSHVLVLLWFLLKFHITTIYWTTKRFFTCMHTNMIFKSICWLTSSITMSTLVCSLTNRSIKIRSNLFSSSDHSREIWVICCSWIHSRLYIFTYCW